MVVAYLVVGVVARAAYRIVVVVGLIADYLAIVAVSLVAIPPVITLSGPSYIVLSIASIVPPAAIIFADSIIPTSKITGAVLSYSTSTLKTI